MQYSIGRVLSQRLGNHPQGPQVREHHGTHLVTQIRLDKEKGSIERAKIIDFGFAVYIANLPNMAEKERYAGTPNFAAP